MVERAFESFGQQDSTSLKEVCDEMLLAEQFPEHDYELAPVLTATCSFNESNSSSATTRPRVPVSH